MTERDIATAAVALALQRSGKASAGSVRTMLLARRDAGQPVRDLADAVDAAGVRRPEINGSLAEVQSALDQGLALGIVPIPIDAEAYPPALRSIADAPPVLFLRGSLAALAAMPGVAVVGTRRASPHGLAIAHRIACYLAEQGYAVVSGLALGVDAAAHEGAVSAGGTTIAVLAHGLERAQPARNRPLANRILDAGGAWVSEHAFGVAAQPEHFVLRNRIQVGLSSASVIVEGAASSGSRSQADYCLRERRSLFAVLPDAGGKLTTHSELPQMLVSRHGAIPIQSRDDYPRMLSVIEQMDEALRSDSSSSGAA